MTAQEIVNQINLDLDAVSGKVFTDAQMLSFVLEGYVDICRETECLTTSVETVLAAYNPLMNLPSNYLRTIQFRWSYNQQLHTRTEKELDDNEDDWGFEVGTPEDLVFYNYDTIRVKPIPSSAGTVTNRHSYYPTSLNLTDEPAIQRVFHGALVDYGSHAAALALREYEFASERWGRYVTARAKLAANVRAQSPAILLTQRPVSAFTWSKWRDR